MRLLNKAGVKPPHSILPILAVIVIVGVLSLLAYKIITKKQRIDRSSNAVGPGHIWSARTIVKYAAILLNIMQVAVGVLFMSIKGLPKESIEWVLLAMWFIVPTANLIAMALLRTRDGG
jgi:hypothetical protein